MNKLKKTIAGLFLTAAMMVSVTGCGESGASKEASKPLNEITSAIKDSDIKFPEMVEVGSENFEFKYDISADDYTEYSVWWAGSGGDADEICIIKAKDDSVDKVKSSVESRLDSQKKNFKDYVPEQYDKLCESKVKTEGNYVYWLCTNDNSESEKILLSYFK